MYSLLIMETVRFFDFYLVCYYFAKKAISMLTVTSTHRRKPIASQDGHHSDSSISGEVKAEIVSKEIAINPFGGVSGSVGSADASNY